MAQTESGDFIDSMSQLVRRVRAVKGQAYAALGVSVIQAKLLRHLQDCPSASQADIARATDTDPALTGRIVETLLNAGHVTRTRSTADRRQYVLELTPAGVKMADDVRTCGAHVGAKIMAALDARDVEAFTRITAKALAALDK